MAPNEIHQRFLSAVGEFAESTRFIHSPAKSCQEQKTKEPAVPEAVEEQAYKNFQSVLKVLVLLAEYPLEHKHYRQVDDVFN